MDVQHSIQLAAKRAGLTPHVIRAWEKRYEAVSPDRSGTNRRRYSDEEIDRLRLLGVLRKMGHPIGGIARLPTPTLRDLAAAPAASALTADTTAPASPSYSVATALADSLEAIRQMDAEGLADLLERSAIALGQHGLLERLVSPLARRLGELWADGTLTAAHEHFATNVLRTFLLRDSRAFAVGSQAPLLVVTTPAGQLHELGATIVAATARDLGWRVRYLGPNLPAADIASAAVATSAKAVALSIVYPGDDPELPGELTLLRRLLPRPIEIIAGGAAAGCYAPVLLACGVITTDEIGKFSSFLTRTRMPAAPPPDSAHSSSSTFQ